MIVLDASVGAAVILNSQPLGGRGLDRLDRAQIVVVPEVFELEVMSTIRGLERGRTIDAERAGDALDALIEMKVVRWPHSDLRRQIFALRHNLTIYDAAYVALAQALDVPLVTADAKLAAAPLSGVTVELL